MSRAGWLHVIAGPMFSGKTDELLRHVRRYDVAGKSLMLFRPVSDTRSENIALSRSGAAYPSTPFSDAVSVFGVVDAADLDVVAVDEAQFADPYLAKVLDDLAWDGRTVLVSGLDKDFLGRPFGPMGELLTMADEVTKLTAICHRCKGEASMTQRLLGGYPAKASDPLVVIGGMGDDRYEARCRACHEVG